MSLSRFITQYRLNDLAFITVFNGQWMNREGNSHFVFYAFIGAEGDRKWGETGRRHATVLVLNGRTVSKRLNTQRNRAPPEQHPSNPLSAPSITSPRAVQGHMGVTSGKRYALDKLPLYHRTCCVQISNRGPFVCEALWHIAGGKSTRLNNKINDVWIPLICVRLRVPRGCFHGHTITASWGCRRS